MSIDLTHALGEWPYDPDDNIRIVEAQDGRRVLQVRQPLGMEQYELDGRPDGLKPAEASTVVEAIEAHLDDFKLTHGSDEGFLIGHEDCVEMQNEGILFYYRYLLLFQLNDFQRVVRDTNHNLKICELLENYCEDEEDRNAVLQFKPYIFRMNAVARAMLKVQQHDRKSAREIIERAIKTVQSMPEISSPAFDFEKVRSVNYLRSALEQVDETPEDPVHQLQEELEEAVQTEDYERAARLRDHIRELS